MATDAYRKFLNTRQRITSTFVNRATSLAARNLQEAMRQILAGDTPRSGVIGGLTVSAVPATMTVVVTAGLALLIDATVLHPDSQHRWCELPGTLAVNIAAADPANPRWDVVEIAPGNASIGPALIDRWNPATGTFLASSLDDEYQPSPTISVRSGTPAASPLFPAGVAGRIPLAYVYVPAAAVGLTAGDVVHCRPMLKAPGSLDVARASKRIVEGGGVAIGADGTTVSLRGCTGHLPSSHAPFGVGVVGSSTSLAVIASSFSGGSLPGADSSVAFFAVAPPYPSGYDTSLALREFRPEASAATRFASLVTPQLSGCIVVASTTHVVNAGTHEGSPTSGGNFSVQAAPWGTGGSPALVAPEDSVYLGSAFFDVGPNVFRAQTERGGVVFPSGVSGPVINLAVAVSPQSTWGIAGTDTFLFPSTALEVQAAITLAVAPSQHASISVSDGTGQACLQAEDVAAGGSLTTRATRQPLFPDSTNGNVSYALSGTASAATLRAVAYRDAVLARR